MADAFTKRQYYLIDGLDNSGGVQILEGTLDEIKNRQYCGACSYPFPHAGAIDVQTSAAISWKPLLAGFGKPTIGIISHELIEILGKGLMENAFWLGKVYGLKGKLSPHVKTFHTKGKLLMLRGGKFSSGEHCASCLRACYCPLPLASQAISDTASPTKEIYQTWNGQLVVAGTFYERIRPLLNKKIVAMPLPFVAMPEHIIAEFPDYV